MEIRRNDLPQVLKRRIYKQKSATQNNKKRLTNLQKLKVLTKNRPLAQLKISYNLFLRCKNHLISKQRPHIISNCPSISPSLQFDVHIKELMLSLGMTSIDVQVSLSNQFSGIYGQQQMLSMSLDQFLTYDGQLTIYIAQLPLYETKNFKNADIFAKERAKIEKQNRYNCQQVLNRLGFLEEFAGNMIKRIHKINLWFSKKETFSKEHYDSYDNFLFMISGQKTFEIKPPNSKQAVGRSICSGNYQQAQFKSKKGSLIVTLRRGEGLFLPKGWYHSVKSKQVRDDGDSIIAINIWFDSIEDSGIGGMNKKFHLRYLMHQEIENQVKLSQQSKYDNEIHNNLRHNTNDTQFLLQHFIYFRENYSSINELIWKLQEYPLDIENILTHLNPSEVEFFTDNLDKLENLTETNLNSCISAQRSKLYELFRSKINFERIQEYFLEQKLELRKAQLSKIAEDLFSQDYTY